MNGELDGLRVHGDCAVGWDAMTPPNEVVDEPDPRSPDDQRRAVFPARRWPGPGPTVQNPRYRASVASRRRPVIDRRLC